MNSSEFLRRERELARRYGLRKGDVLFQMVRCTECGTEALLRSRFNRHEFTSISAAETRVLEVIQRSVSARCGKCGCRELDGTGSRHVFLMYGERVHAHLALTLRMQREDDGRVKVRRQVWFVPDDGDAEEIEVEDERLDAFWKDSRIRFCAARHEPDRAAADLQALTAELPDDALLLRELGNSLIDGGRTARALAAFERSLAAKPDQPSTLRKAARLYSGLGRPERSMELLTSAFALTDDPGLLPELALAAYRTRRMDTLEKVSLDLLEHEPESLIARKALVSTRSIADVGAMRDAWCDLKGAAARAGAKGTERVAAFWADALSLPIPDWADPVGRDGYVGLLVEELRDWGLEVVAEPEPLTLGDAEIPVDVEAVSDVGEHVLFCVFDQAPTVALEQRLIATARAAREQSGRVVTRIIPLCSHPLPYSMMGWMSGAPDPSLLIDADADTTMTVVDENIAAFVVAAERHFGRTLEFDIDSLAEVDAILARLHDDGFGEITYAFQCQAAAYVGAVLASAVDGSSWQQGDEDMDPRIFVLPTGEEINLISKVGKAVRNGNEDSLVHFVSVLLEHAEAS